MELTNTKTPEKSLILSVMGNRGLLDSTIGI